MSICLQASNCREFASRYKLDLLMNICAGILKQPLFDIMLDPLEILKPVYYWITARSDHVLYNFVIDEILTRSKGSDLSIWNAWLNLILKCRDMCPISMTVFS